MASIRKYFWNGRVTVAGAFVFFLAVTILCAVLPDVTGWTVLASIGAFITGAIVAWHLSVALIRRSLWRLRNRLIITYVFIGVVPLVLVTILVALGGYICAGQTAMYLVNSELDRTLDSLKLPARILSMNPQSPPSEVLDQVANFIRQRFPAFEVVIRKNNQIVHYPRGAGSEPASADAPSYTGLTIKDGMYYAWSHSLVEGMTVDVLAPLDREMLGDLVPHLGQVEISGDHVRLGRRHKITPEDLHQGEANSLPPPKSRLDYPVNMVNFINVSEWGTGRRNQSTHLLLITTRPSALLGAIFGEKYTFALSFLFVFAGVATLFLLVEMVSLVIGVSLTRSITGAMQELYFGTRRVAEGEFSHRIKVKGRDQLAAVAESFNSMTERLERLVIVEKEKERLQSELEIAREVQNQLFPRSSPKMKTLEINGLCRPASMVSGDYYDFLCLQDSKLAIAIGDVAGKGISAALLMASIQSIMRTQLTSATPVLAAAVNGPPRNVYSTSRMVSQLNNQLYLSTSPEKYATFMFGVYDEQERIFTYTNAGHLPSILIRKGAPQLLEVTGTVVGAFPACLYEEQKVHLEPGDLLVSYTDGITEPENEYGEEFGADRLVETLMKHHKLDADQLIRRVMDAVRAWTSAPELPDDMTLVLARSVD